MGVFAPWEDEILPGGIKEDKSYGKVGSVYKIQGKDRGGNDPGRTDAGGMLSSDGGCVDTQFQGTVPHFPAGRKQTLVSASVGMCGRFGGEGGEQPGGSAPGGEGGSGTGSERGRRQTAFYQNTGTGIPVQGQGL